MAERKYSEPKCAFKLVDDHVVTDKSIANKITGTSLSAVLGLSPFSSPFQAACAMLGVGREVLDGKPAVEIGKYLEEKLIDYCGERYSNLGIFIKAEDAFEKREGEHDGWASDWQDDLFAGHLDGIVTNEDGDFVLEVKTSSNIGAWEDGVPQNYMLQVALYNHFMYQKDHAYVILGIVDEETRKDVTSWVPSDDNVLLFKVDMDEKWLQDALETATAWYERFVAQGETPVYNPLNQGDIDLWQHLQAISAADEDIQNDLDRLIEIRDELNTKSEALAALEDEAQALEKKIKDYMVHTHKLELVSASKGMAGTITRSVRTRIDKKLMVEAGVDPTPFTVSTTVNSFSLKAAKTQTP